MPISCGFLPWQQIRNLLFHNAGLTLGIAATGCFSTIVEPSIFFENPYVIILPSPAAPPS
jgi:hypothetical protein